MISSRRPRPARTRVLRNRPFVYLTTVALLGCPEEPPTPPGLPPPAADPAAEDLAAAPTSPPPDAETGWQSQIYQRYAAAGPVADALPDFSRAGYREGDAPLPSRHERVFQAAAYGAVPDDGRDDTLAIQQALDSAGRAGGGLVLLPPGRLDVHTTREGPFVVIRRSGVVLRGAGSGEGGTLLYLGAPAPYNQNTGPLPRPGSSERDPRRVAAVSIIGPEPGAAAPLARYTRALRRGEDVATVDSTAALAPGQLVRLTLRSEGATPDLPEMLTSPFRLGPRFSVTRGPHGQALSWLVRVAQIVDGTHVRLAQPARLDHLLEHSPELHGFAGIDEVGIEGLRIASAWPGGYAHHKPYPWDATDQTALRSEAEQDYLWAGIWVSQAYNGWIRDVTIVDCTQGVRLQHVAHFTIEGLRHEGLDGHHGVHLARAHNVLVRGYEARARLVHPLSVESWSSGNVFLGARCSYAGTDPQTGTGPYIDFHGLFPYENLYDGLRGCYVKPGGDLEVLPHAGVRNTFWNIELPRQMDYRAELYGEGEFFRTHRFTETSGRKPEAAHEHFPQSFVVGVQREGSLPVRIAGAAQDRADGWLTVEGAGRQQVRPASLYEAQRERRRAGER